MKRNDPMIWVINEKDNVGTVVGCDIELPMKVPLVGAISGVLETSQAIPYGHKIALLELPPQAKVIKYGHVIGALSARARKGSHVHTHNLESARGRGDVGSDK